MVESIAVIRPFDWRDVALLYRVRDRGLCTDSQLSFTRGANALQQALLDVFSPGKTTLTLVARPAGKDKLAAVGQCVLHNGQPNAKLAFIGPTDALEQDSGDQLLDALAQAAGEHGAHNLVADIDEKSPLFERLRHAGFAIYARQRIWRFSDSAPEQGEFAESAWRVEIGSDEPAAQGLYHNIVPGLVQQVEPPPTHTGNNLVHWRQGELLGYLDLERGPLGTWVQPYFHPAAEGFDVLLAGFLPDAFRPDRPLYVCVRSYQSWMGGPLERLGFEPCTDQAVMVKRLAAGVRKPATSRLPAVEGTYPEPTAPFARSERTAPVSQSGGGK